MEGNDMKYNAYNIAIANNILKYIACFTLFVLLLTTFVYATPQKVKKEKLIFITLNYKDNSLTVVDISSAMGYLPAQGEPRPGIDKGALRIYSKNGMILYDSYFYIQNKRFIDILDEQTGELSGGFIEINDVDFTITAPYYSDVGRIVITSKYGTVTLTRSDLTGQGKFNMDKIASVPAYGKSKINSNSEARGRSLLSQIMSILTTVYGYTVR
ncbi:MAG: hypothetical protein QW112_02820 [Candidatus Micrarchaeia archaeon]